MTSDLSLKILDHLPYSLLVIDRELTPIYCNSSFLELIEQDDPLAPFNIKKIFSNLPELIEQKGNRFCKILTTQNKEISVFIAISIIENDFYLIEVSRLSSAAHDYQRRRLETLGLMASSISHDFNNFLAGIIGHVAYLKNILPNQGNHIQSLEAIENGSVNASEITKEILRFSKVKAPVAQEVELKKLIQRTVDILLASINPKVKVNFESKVSEVNVLCIDVRITQVIINLILNAQDAILESNCINSNILITLDVVKNPKISNQNQSSLLEGEFARISVKDFGIGMSSEVKDKIFNPYFSTKGEQGTGLGLSTVCSIVFDLNGYIEVVSELGQGTEMIILLPAINGITSQKREDSPPDNTNNKSFLNQNILVIDDEEVVRNVLGLNLAQLGFKVKLEPSALKGIDYYKEHKDDISLVILDMLMPELSGEEVFEIIREINPLQKILIVSGFCSDDLVEMMLDTKNCDFLAKPFMIEELSQKIAVLLSKS